MSRQFIHQQLNIRADKHLSDALGRCVQFLRGEPRELILCSQLTPQLLAGVYSDIIGPSLSSSLTWWKYLLEFTVTSLAPVCPAVSHGGSTCWNLQ